MKKYIYFIALLCVTGNARAQTIILSENFDSYNGLVTSIPPGFVITWNDTSSASKSFYSTSGFCGMACNSYKFGVDSATIITPVFSGAGSVSFYLKGNGTYKPNSFKVFETNNGATWTLISSIDSIPTVSQTVTLPVNPASIQLQFYYKKDSLGFNAGFDDLVIYGPVGINEIHSINDILVYPTPANNSLQLDFGTRGFSEMEISLMNILGKEIYKITLSDNSSRFSINLSDFPDGIYLLKLKSGFKETVKRVIVKK